MSEIHVAVRSPFTQTLLNRPKALHSRSSHCSNDMQQKTLLSLPLTAPSAHGAAQKYIRRQEGGGRRSVSRTNSSWMISACLVAQMLAW